MKVSVLMSVYNGEEYLAESIKSVIDQTYKKFEFIIINDGSIDGSIKIIKSFERRDSRIKIIDKQNTGLTDSLNCGLNEVKGEWIARIDADDICMPDRLEKQLRYIQTNQKTVLLGASFFEIDYKGRILRKIILPEDHKSLKSHLEKHKNFFPHSSAFIKREIIAKLGRYRSRVYKAEDIDMWLRFSEYGNIGCVKEPLIKLRKHDNQISYRDGGWIQYVFSTIAIISHIMREQDLFDPVELDEDKWNVFTDWVKKELRNSVSWKTIKEWDRLKKFQIKDFSDIELFLFAVKWKMTGISVSQKLVNKMCCNKIINSCLESSCK